MMTCKELAAQVKDKVKDTLNVSPYFHEYRPTLAIVSVGEDPASEAYVRGKKKDCIEVGVRYVHTNLASNCTQSELNEAVKHVNKEYNAVIVQLPLPKHLDASEALSYIDPWKDVDGLLEGSSFTPCTALGVFEFLKANTELQGKHVVIINRSHLVGRPLAKLLLDADATVTICHSKTTHIRDCTKQADIVVTAVGIPDFLDYSYVKQDAIVVDVGITKQAGKLWGDYTHTSFDDNLNITVTPVPGGVGLLTRAYLMQNVLQAARRQ